MAGHRPPRRPVRGRRASGRGSRLLPAGCVLLTGGLLGRRLRRGHASGIAGRLAIAAPTHYSLPPTSPAAIRNPADPTGDRDYCPTQILTGTSICIPPSLDLPARLRPSVTLKTCTSRTGRHCVIVR